MSRGWRSLARRASAVSIAALVLAFATTPALAQGAPAPVPSGTVTTSINRTVKTGSGESVRFYVWRATSFDVTEYRLSGRDLGGALRQHGQIEVDTSALTALRTQSFQGQQGDITIPSRPGIYVYVAQATGGGSGTGQQVQAVNVSDLGIGVKRDDQRSIVFAHLGDTPARGTRVEIFETTASASRIGTYFISSFAGAIAVPTPATGAVTYVARRGRHTAVQHGWDRSWTRNTQRLVAHVQTDRSLYRPGHTVEWKAIVRETVEPSRSYRTPVGENVHVFLRDDQGNRQSLGSVATNEFGTVSGSYTLSDSAGLGDWQIELEGTPVPGATWNPPLGSVNFGVEEFRKPEYEVIVTPAASRAVQGETVHATITGRYFFGAPVGDARVEWTVKKQFTWRWWNPWIRPMFIDFMPYPFPRGGGTVVASGSARTDVDGSAQIQFDTTRDGYDTDYVISAKVTDASDREVSGSGTISVARAAFDLVLVTDRSVYTPGDYVRVRANVANDGGPVAGESVEFSIDQIDPDGTRNHRFDITRSTDGDGTANLLLIARNKNRYVISAKATDVDGNEVTSERHVWVHDSRGGVDWSWNSIELTADKELYEVGDTARFLVRAPVTGGRGIFTMEAGGIQRAMSFPIYFGLGLVEVEITESMTPNIFATVMVASDTGLKTASKELQVPPSDKLVDVTIVADKAEYRPGETATFHVRAVDVNGNPVRAEVALGVVDEALWSIRDDQTQELAQRFFPRTGNLVHTLGGTGGGGGIFFRSAAGGPLATAHAPAPEAADAAGDVAVRENFQDTLRWIAHLETDLNGEATITQEMADNLTTWRLTARAVTTDTKVGETRTKTLVTKDLIVRLATPRTFTEGDEVTLVGVVHNLAKEGSAGDPSAQVSVELQTDGVAILDGASRNVTIARNGKATVSWNLRVDAADTSTIQATAIAAHDQDALRLEIPVNARGVKETEVVAGAMRNDGRESLTLTKLSGAIDDATMLTVDVTPSVSGTVFDSLDYLVGFPYGCIEQTMSRFLPDVIVAEVLRTIGREDSDLLAQLPEMVQVGTDKISGMQNADGGWGWFARNGSHPMVSAYVMNGLALARREGFPVPDETFDKAVAFLEGQLDAGSATADESAYMLWALTTAGVVRQGDLTRTAARRAELNDYTKAALVISLVDAGMSNLTTDLIGDLTQSAVVSAGKAHWEGSSIRYGSWTSNNVETTAYVLRAFLAADSSNPLVTDAVTWLMGRRRANGQYTTTKDTAAVVLAIAHFVRVSNELDPDMNVTVTINGAAQSFVFTAADLAKEGQSIEVPGSSLNSGANSVIVERTGRGVLYYSATLEQVVRMDPIPAADNGIGIARSFFKVQSQLDATTGQMVETEVPLSGPVALGEQIRVKLDVTVSKNADVEHVNIEDRFAAGFEVVSEQPNNRFGPIPFFTWWSPWASAREIHDDRVVFFATYLGRVNPDDGSRTFQYTYDLRAEVAGTFTSLPAFAEAVYAPGTNGRSDGATVRIVR